MKRSSNRKTLFRTITAVAGMAVAWIVAELVLIIVNPQPLRTTRLLERKDPPVAAYYCYSSNPNGEFGSLPDLSRGRWTYHDFSLEAVPLPLERLKETPYCVKVEQSSIGLRDREYDAAPAAGVTRIACIGDSFIYGQGVSVEGTVPRQMEGLLGSAYEVVNAGRVAVDLHREAEFMQQIVPGLQCSRAIVVFIPNDVQLSAKLTLDQDYINDLINIRDRYVAKRAADAWYAGPSRVLRLVGSAIDARVVSRKTIQWYRDMYDPAINGPALNQLRADLQRIAATPNCRVAVVVYPLMVGLEKEYPLQETHNRVARMAREAGLPLLDLAPVFKGIKTESLQVHPTDHHPNGKAHAIAAKAIVDWLRTDVAGFLDK
jgi:lysophospholipase L1-like esterase